MDEVERSAILLLGMGEKQAADVLKHMDAKLVEKIVQKMTSMKSITREEVNAALKAFNETSSSQTSLAIDTGHFIRSALVDALGEERAETLIDKSTIKSDLIGINALNWLDPPAVMSLIRDEHPQIIAVIVMHLDSELTAKVLAMFATEQRNDVMRRITAINSISPQALKVLDDKLGQEAREIRSYKTMTMGGAKLAADIINYMQSDVESEVLEDLASFSEDLSEQVQELMFPFERLASLDNRSMQTLLRDVPKDALVLALKGADDSVQQTFLSNMSERAADMLKDDLEAMGPVALGKVVEAQKSLVTIAQKMAKDGQIVLGTKGGDMVG